MTNSLHFALVVGINRYPGLPEKDLTTAANDAVAFREWLTDPRGGALPTGNVRTVETTADDVRLSGPMFAQPTRQAVDLALASLHDDVEQEINGDAQRWRSTRLYIFLSGHGILPTVNGEAGLLMADATRETPGAHVEVTRYVDYLVRCTAFREVVVFADCCRAPEDVAAQGPGLRHCFGTNGDVVTLIGYAAERGDPAFGRRSRSDPACGRGVFTEALLRALRGRSQPTARILRESIGEHMRRILGDSRSQRPVIKTNDVDDIVLGRPATAPQQGTVKLTLYLPADAFDVQLRDGGLNPVQFWPVPPTPITVEVFPGFYQVLELGRPARLLNNGLFEVGEEDSEQRF